MVLIQTSESVFCNDSSDMLIYALIFYQNCQMQGPYVLKSVEGACALISVTVTTVTIVACMNAVGANKVSFHMHLIHTDGMSLL